MSLFHARLDLLSRKVSLCMKRVSLCIKQGPMIIYMNKNNECHQNAAVRHDWNGLIKDFTSISRFLLFMNFLFV